MAHPNDTPWRFFAALAGLVIPQAALAVFGPAGLGPLSFAVLYLAAFACLVPAARLFPESLRFGRGLALILVPAALVKLAYVFCYPSDRDLARYVFEGLVQLAGHNPYVLPPAGPELAGLRAAHPALADVIGHPDLTAIYPPLSELVFAVLARISPTALAFKLALTLFDLGAALALGLILRMRSLPVSRLILYALNPLVGLFVSGEGHLDALAVFLLTLGLYAFCARREAPGFFALGLSVMAKYTFAPVLPFFATAQNWRPALFALVPVLLYLPYQDAGSGLFASLGIFAAKVHAGGAACELLRAVFGPYWAYAAPTLLAGTWIFIWLTEPDRERGAYLGLGAMVLLSPTVYPWYLCGPAAFMALHPSRAWLALMAAQAFYLPATAAFDANAALRVQDQTAWFGQTVFCLIALYDGLKRRRLLPPIVYPEPASLAVVVPALNEEANIASCLDSVAEAARRAGVPVSAVVADGGSGDGTAAIATGRGALVVSAPRGRGRQIRAGIEVATADCYLVLHADCRLEPDALAGLLAALRARPDAAGGALGMRGGGDFALARLVTAINNLKTWLTGISFGDQGQFVRREALTRLRGFPDLALMEDVEFSLRLRELGGIVYVGRGVVASSRAWKALGFIANFRRILPLVCAFLVNRRLSLAIDPAAYYQSYYVRLAKGKNPEARGR